MRQFFKKLTGRAGPKAKGSKKASQRQTKDHITTEERGHLFLICLDRAKKRNAINPEMARELARAFGAFEQSTCRCAVLHAAGDDFTIGLDLKAFRGEMERDSWGVEEEGQINPWGLEPPYRSKPIVTAVQGYCYTAGLELALAGDIVIAAEGSRFGQLEIRRGLMPFGGGTTRLVERAGWGNAMRYLLTSDAFDVQEAHRMGVVQEIVEPGNQLERALELAELIAIQAPLGVRGTLRAAHVAVYQGPQAAHDLLDELRREIVASKDVREGMMALMQGRKPKFSGE